MSARKKRSSDAKRQASKGQSASPLSIKTQPPRNPVVYAMAHRAASAGAGRHTRSGAAQRRAEVMSLQKQLRHLDGKKTGFEE
ncbi:MAG: hypothetical protein V4772_12000 [Pseudomonadota bacterium]